MPRIGQCVGSGKSKSDSRRSNSTPTRLARRLASDIKMRRGWVALYLRLAGASSRAGLPLDSLSAADLVPGPYRFYVALPLLPLPQPRSQTGNIDIRKKPSDPSCRAIVVLLVQFSRRIKIGQAGCENSLNTLPACPFPPLCFSGSPPPPPLCQLLPRQQFPDPFSRLADLIIFQMPAIPNFPTRHNHDQIPIPKCRVYPGMAPVAYYFDGRSLESV